MEYKKTELHTGDGWTISELTTQRVTDAEATRKHFKKVIGENMEKQEVFAVMALDGASNIIYTKAVFKGTLNQSLVHPREVFSDAILHRASGVIICHNHPSGTTSASRQDMPNHGQTQRSRENY